MRRLPRTWCSSVRFSICHEVRQCCCEGRPATSCSEEVAPLSADDKDEMAEERESVEVGSRADMFRRQMDGSSSWRCQ